MKAAALILTDLKHQHIEDSPALNAAEGLLRFTRDWYGYISNAAKKAHAHGFWEEMYLQQGRADAFRSDQYREASLGLICAAVMERLKLYDGHPDCLPLRMRMDLEASDILDRLARHYPDPIVRWQAEKHQFRLRWFGSSFEFTAG